MKNKETLEEFIKEITKNFKDEMSIKFTTGGIKLGAKWMQDVITIKVQIITNKPSTNQNKWRNFETKK
jgi:hypothetical protein